MRQLEMTEPPSSSTTPPLKSPFRHGVSRCPAALNGARFPCAVAALTSPSTRLGVSRRRATRGKSGGPSGEMRSCMRGPTTSSTLFRCRPWPRYLVAVRGWGSWLRRTVDGLLYAGASLLLSAVGHATAGGRLPGPGTLLLVLGVLTILGTVLLGRRRSRFDVSVLALGVFQFVLHVTFHLLSAGHPPRAEDSGPTATRHLLPHRHHPVDAPMSDMGAPAPSGGEVLAATHSMTTTMTAGHALATLGTATGLVLVKRLLGRLAVLLRSGLRCPVLAILPLPGDLHRPMPTMEPLPHYGAMLTRSRPRRGPPLLVPA